MKITLDELIQRISDPGAFLPRGDDFNEPIPAWSARAVLALIEGQSVDAAQNPAIPSTESQATARRYSGELWLDDDDAANFKFHIEGGDFPAASRALQKFITCLQDRLIRADECPYSERLLNHCVKCGREFYYSYESDTCPSCHDKPTNHTPPERMRHELENIYMMARMKRAVRHRYPEGFPEVPAESIGPKSDDADWDHIIRFCEQAGLKPTILRTMKATPATPSSEASG